jgi:hypothetical protein
VGWSRESTEQAKAEAGEGGIKNGDGGILRDKVREA